jgi:hypothetical protein
MPHFQKKPVVLEAEQYLSYDESFDTLNAFCEGHLQPELPHGINLYMIKPLGRMLIQPGDWVVRSEDGAYHRHDAASFMQNYEQAPEPVLNTYTHDLRGFRVTLDVAALSDQESRVQIGHVSATLYLPVGIRAATLTQVI